MQYWPSLLPVLEGNTNFMFKVVGVVDQVVSDKVEDE